MRICQVAAAATAAVMLFSGAAGAAALSDVPAATTDRAGAATTLDLPLEAMILDDRKRAFAVDRLKARADLKGISYASNEAAFETRIKREVTVVDASSAAAIDNMNVRFYGSLLVFAAGCLMYLGVTVRRYP